jgi:hypothetical protein
VTDALAPIAVRLGKLLRMLSSPRGGEVLAAAGAIIRTLESVKLDVHALAARVEAPNGFNEVEARKLYNAGFEDGLAKAQNRAATFANLDGTPTWQDMAVWCAQQGDRLQPREREFVDQMAAQTVWREPTERQGMWLKSIFYRLGGRRT